VAGLGTVVGTFGTAAIEIAAHAHALTNGRVPDDTRINTVERGFGISRSDSHYTVLCARPCARLLRSTEYLA
jgi:hypothetical protein